MRDAPFGGPVVPEVRMIVRPGRRVDGGRCPLAAAMASARSSSHAGPLAPLAGRNVRELVVVNQDAHALGPHHGAQLRCREAGVEQDQIGGCLRRGQCGGHEAPVVAAHHTDTDTRSGTEREELVGDAVRLAPECFVRDGAVVVDEGEGAWIAGHGGGHAGRRAEAPRQGGGQRPRQAVGALERDVVHPCQRSAGPRSGARGTAPGTPCPEVRAVRKLGTLESC